MKHAKFLPAAAFVIRLVLPLFLPLAIPLTVPLAAAILVSPALTPSAWAQNDAGTGDANAGATVAKTWCANCHAVTGNRSALDAAPPFPTLAVERTLGEIRAFLAQPHGLMPNIQLSRQQIDDVVAYFGTLR